MDIQGDLNIDDSTGFNSVFNNFGTVRKSAGTGTATIETQFNVDGTGANEGLVDIQMGTLQLSAQGTNNNGTFTEAAFVDSTMANDAELEFTGAAVTWTFDALSTVAVSRVEVTNGTVILGGAAALGNVTLAGGVLTLNNTAGHTLASYTQTAGTLTGSGPVMVAGPMVWNGGTITDTSAVNVAFDVNGGLAAGTTTRTLDGRTINLNSNTTWTFGVWAMTNGAVLNNNAGARLDIQGDLFVDDSTGFNSVFNNFGTVRKTAGAARSPKRRSSTARWRTTRNWN